MRQGFAEMNLESPAPEFGQGQRASLGLDRVAAGQEAEHTETFSDESTVAYVERSGAPAEAGEGDLPEAIPEGWPNGVPVQLAERYGGLERLGQGGNGVVFRATDKRLDREVVLKFMIDGAMPSEVARRYFLREVKISASLNHNNIVHIYDMGNIDGVLFYCMEYVEGHPLTNFLGRGEPVRDPIFIMSAIEQLSAALDHAHGAGLIHRDIKPDNILIAKDGTVKLLDFGLSRALDDGFGENSVLAGTPFYMAPEQFDGSEVDHRADIYAVGVIIFRMFTGRLPYTENVFVAHALEPVPDPRQFNPDMPQAVIDVIMRCMAKRPDERYENCRLLALDMQRGLFQRGGNAATT